MQSVLKVIKGPQSLIEAHGGYASALIVTFPAKTSSHHLLNSAALKPFIYKMLSVLLRWFEWFGKVNL